MSVEIQDAAVPERRAFTVHANLLRDVLEKQAGTVDKAILETVMNLIEARATEGRVTITPGRIVVADDGKGFESRTEILEAFEMFGKSDERKLEEKRFAQFQMGRGQMLALGKAVYRTRSFMMTSDIRNDDVLGYHLTEHLADQPGCVVTVDLYERLTEFDIINIVRDLKRAVRYVDVPIFVNGEQVNEDPVKQRWGLETDEAYYRFTEATNRLDVYNRGVFVESLYDYGIGGVVVSKGQLAVNFARNQIIRSCPTWAVIRKQFRQKTKRPLLEKTTFSAEEARSVIAMLMGDEIMPYQASGLKLLKDINGKRRSFRDLKEKQIAFDTRGTKHGEAAMRFDSNMVVLDREYVSEVLGATEKSFKVLFAEVLEFMFPSEYDRIKMPVVVPTLEVYEKIKINEVPVDEKSLDKVTSAALAIARETVSHSVRCVRVEPKVLERHLALGESETSASWTDGERYIVLELQSFRKGIWTLAGWTQIMLRVAAMYCYTAAETTRDTEYYERYYAFVEPFVSRTDQCFRKFVKTVLERHPERAGRVRAEMLALETLEGIDEDEALALPLDDRSFEG